MWIYIQLTGELLRDWEHVGFGYAGKGTGKNNPAMQSVHNVGPLPCGLYAIGDPVDTVTHGPFVLLLTPHEDNQMFGRSAFLIHGDSMVSLGNASEGCIIQNRLTRVHIAESGDKLLRVVSGVTA